MKIKYINNRQEIKLHYRKQSKTGKQQRVEMTKCEKQKDAGSLRLK